MELAASAPVPIPESAVRPVEATADPTSTLVDGHDAGVKAAPTDNRSTTGSKAGVETSAATGGNQSQESTGACSATEAHAPASEADASKTQETPAASPLPSDKQIDAATFTECPSDAVPSTPAASETPMADTAVAEPVISGDSTIDELMAVAASVAPLSAAATPYDQSTPQPSEADKPAKKEKKPNDSFLPDKILTLVQQFLADKIAHNQCSSHSRDILEFVGQHMNDKQRRRYVGPLVQRIVEQFANEARAKGEEMSVDVQTSICLVEQMFLTLGRESPLQDMYTQEEEEMLDLLFHGEGGFESEIASPD